VVLRVIWAAANCGAGGAAADGQYSKCRANGVARHCDVVEGTKEACAHSAEAQLKTSKCLYFDCLLMCVNFK